MEEETPGHDLAGERALAGAAPVKRDFPAAKVNTKWYGDGTEIKTSEGKTIA